MEAAQGFLQLAHVAAGLLVMVVAMVAQAMRYAAREAILKRRVDDLEKWKDSRGERDTRMYAKLDKIIERLARLEALVSNGSAK